MSNEQEFIKNIIIKHLRKSIAAIVRYELKPSLLKYKFEDDESMFEQYALNRIKFNREIIVHIAPLAYSIANTLALHLYEETFQRKSDITDIAKEIESMIFAAMKSLLNCNDKELVKELFVIDEKS